MKVLVLILMLHAFSIWAQDLSQQRIWKISSKKRAIFLDKGVFYNNSDIGKTSLTGIRNSYVPSRGYERLVLDFNSSIPPRVYGHISIDEKKLYLDLFNTSISKAMDVVKNVKYIDSVDFFNLDKENLSVEIKLKEKVSFDIFYLENPGRLVIDIKK